MGPAMSQPRHILPGATYLITRRVLRRHFLLRPDSDITRILLYVLAFSARLYGIQVHAFCAMSTHLHLVVTDRLGLLPDFLRDFHRIVALCTKVLRKWEGPVWDHEPTSVVQLLTHDAVIQKISYVLANPVAAGLVEHAHQWPGAKTDVSDLGCQTFRATRPTDYLDPTNPQWPEEATLPLELPPTIPHDGADDFRRQVAAELERLEAEAHVEMQRQRLRFLGAKRAREVSPYDRATSFEPLRARNPTVAVGHNKPKALRIAAAKAVRAYRALYRSALDRWSAGDRTALFPAGTWWMRVFHGAGIDHVMLVV
jgi:putative transposase